MDIKEALKTSDSITSLLPNYKFLGLSVGHVLSGENLCYVTLNATYKSLKKLFDKRRINSDNYFFIDGISEILENPVEQKGCKYISVRKDLEQLRKAIMKNAKPPVKVVIVDSIPNLLVHHKIKEVTLFMKDIIEKLNKKGIKVALCIPNTIQHEELIKKISKITDTVAESS